MKKLLLILLTISFVSCSSDDNNNSQQGPSRYPKTVDIRFEVTPAVTNQSIATITIGGEQIIDELQETELPFSFTSLQETVNLGTGVTLKFTDDTAVSPSPTEPWQDYDAVLKIFVDNEEVVNETIGVTQLEPSVTVTYTFI